MFCDDFGRLKRLTFEDMVGMNAFAEARSAEMSNSFIIRWRNVAEDCLSFCLFVLFLPFFCQNY